MKTELVQTLTTTFEVHAQQTDGGVEYWLARDLQDLLGYTEWRNFTAVIAKAETACEVSGHAIPDHFVEVNKTIQMPIRRKGDQALFSKTTLAMKAQWKVPDNRPLADFAPTIILKAKDFATEITIFNARQHGMQSESAISSEHITNNQAVRKTLLERGIRPETLPAAEDVKRVKRRLASEEKKSLKNPDSLRSEE
jgi:DNA-damage-inducible protein D